MATIQVTNIVKRFGAQAAVDDVSFDVYPGEIFGLLGPNGAGKTTTIRIILDIFKPDSGKVAILGGEMTEAKKDRIGYLPEERGLYQDIQLEEGLTYLATLKGLDKPEAARRIGRYLEQFDLAEARKKKIKELSKGMQQKAQLIVTLVHQPELIIIDEPFSALDPVNTQMVKDLLRDERAAGRTVIMCTHQMHQVEALCDRLVLINQGKVMLYGKLDEIQRQYASREVLVRSSVPLPIDLPGVDRVEHENSTAHLHFTKGTNAQDILKELVSRGIPVEQFEIAMPNLDEIFIEVVSRQGDRG